MNDQPIPSPFQFEGNSKQVVQAPINMGLVSAFIVAMKEQLNLKGVFLVLKTSVRHEPCGDPKCDGYTKVVMNEKFSNDELSDLAQTIQNKVDEL